MAGRRTILSCSYTYLQNGRSLGAGKDLHLALLPGPDDGAVGLQVEVFLSPDVHLPLHHLVRGRKARGDVTAPDGVHRG